MLKKLVLIGISFIAGCFVSIHLLTQSKEDSSEPIQRLITAEIQESKESTSNHFFFQNDVYICKGPKSKRYHLKESCRGLKPCSTKIYTVPLSDAKELGRTLCGWEN